MPILKFSESLVKSLAENVNLFSLHSYGSCSGKVCTRIPIIMCSPIRKSVFANGLL